MNSSHRELFELLEALCEERMTDEQCAQLEHLLLADPEARSIYVNYVDLHGSLYWDTALGGQSHDTLDIAATHALTDVAADEISAALADRELAPPLQNATRPIAASKRFRQVAVASTAACLLLLAWSAFDWPQRGTTLEQPNLAETNLSGANLPQTKNELADPGQAVATAKSASRRGNRQPIVLDGMRQADSKSPATNAPGQATQPQPAEQTPTVAESKSPRVRSSRSELLAFVNTQLQAGWQDNEVQPSAVADDAEWVRRVYLDIVGHIPPPEAAAQFLKDQHPDKRSRLIDTLLDDMGYVRNWTTVWANLLVGRSATRDVNRPALEKYLRESFAQNRPWNQMVTDFVSAEGDFEENGAANFLLAHLNNQAVPATAITARLFMGTQVQCTQCHNHPFNDWTQNQFWELNSFFKQTTEVTHHKFDAKAGRNVFSRAELVNRNVGGPTYYETRAGLEVAVFPTFGGERIGLQQQVNRRFELAQLMTAGAKPQIAEAMVNRLWEHFFGNGLNRFTQPVDDMGPHNPCSHPELLDRLSREFVASGYDLKELIRWICQSDAYQLTSRFNPSNQIDDPTIGDFPLFSRMYVKAMTAEQVYDSLIVATGADRLPGANWDDEHRKRLLWIQQFVIPFETDENDEASTFDGTISQALMMMNGTLIGDAVSGERGTYFDKIARDRSHETEKIRQLCLAALSRYPTAREVDAVRKLLRENVAATPRDVSRQVALRNGLQDVFWAYLNSNEFVLIH